MLLLLCICRMCLLTHYMIIIRWYYVSCCCKASSDALKCFFYLQICFQKMWYVGIPRYKVVYIQSILYIYTYTGKYTYTGVFFALLKHCTLSFLLRLSRVSLSDGSESDSSSPSPPPRNEAPPLLKTTNNQVSWYYIMYQVFLWCTTRETQVWMYVAPTTLTLTGCVYSVLCQILEVKSPSKQSKQDKNKNLDCDKVHQPSLFSSMKQPV